MPFLIVFLLLFLLTWSPIPLWDWLPPALRAGQYSWRLLSELSLMGALLFAWSLSWLFQHRLDTRHLVVGLFCIILATRIWFPNPELQHLPLSQVTAQPVLAEENSHDYLIDKNLAEQFHTLQYDKLIPGKMILSDVDYVLPLALISHSYQPTLGLTGNLPSNTSLKSTTVTVSVNGKSVATYSLHAGHFAWNIPLTAFRQTQHADSLSLRFHITDTSIKTPTGFRGQAAGRRVDTVKIPVEAVVVTGFLNLDTTLMTSQVKKYCSQQQQDTVCKIPVPSNIKLLELPIFYYPNMLDITINGRSVTYSNVLYTNGLMAAVTPIPGQLNIIKIRFCGLLAANDISQLSWGLWLLFFIFIALKSYKAKTHANG